MIECIEAEPKAGNQVSLSRKQKSLIDAVKKEIHATEFCVALVASFAKADQVLAVEETSREFEVYRKTIFGDEWATIEGLNMYFQKNAGKKWDDQKMDRVAASIRHFRARLPGQLYFPKNDELVSCNFGIVDKNDRKNPRNFRVVTDGKVSTTLRVSRSFPFGLRFEN